LALLIQKANTISRRTKRKSEKTNTKMGLLTLTSPLLNLIAAIIGKTELKIAT
jgi:hypothetical protein